MFGRDQAKGKARKAFGKVIATLGKGLEGLSRPMAGGLRREDMFEVFMGEGR